MTGSNLLYGKERRYHRFGYSYSLEFCLAAEPSEIFEAVTNDIGAGGLCFYVDRELYEGELIEIRKCLLPYPIRTARVCWVKKADGNYMAGCEFLF